MYKKEDKDVKVEQAMWQAFVKNKSKTNRDRLIEYYLDFASMIAKKAYMYFGGMVEYGDLLNDGAIGLIDAISKFNYTKDIKFSSYAYRRIFGEILDAQRRRDWKTRSQRDKEKKAITPVNAVEITYLQEMFENSQFEPISQAAKVDIEKVENRVDNQNVISKIKENLCNLTEQERKVIILYYVKNMTLAKIGVSMGLSEARISCIKTKALSKLATDLKKDKSLLKDFVPMKKSCNG